jgi:coenzyme F420-dependent glucose-6-phosphate dehydrogenase
MTRLGYHASHEQFAPRELLELVTLAEKAGFAFCLSSDHFAPWSLVQGQSGFAWSWLGAAMSRTGIDFGIVNCPAFRYHPAIIAQAAATLDQMFPGRFWLSVGSGQALNESITGDYWPQKNERNERLKAAADIIRALWKGETVTSKGPIKVSGARLYTRPVTKMEITGAAISPETAAWLAPWADSLITISQPLDKLREVVEAWRSNGGDGKPMKIKVQISYDTTMDAALKGAYEQWKTNAFASDVQSELRSPEQFTHAALHVNPEEMKDLVNISESTHQHLDWIMSYVALGFTDIIIHNVNRNQERFIEDFGAKVLPEFSSQEVRYSR